MSGSVLWGILAITALSLFGFASLAAVGVMQRVPLRLRRAISAIGWVLYGLFMSASVHELLLGGSGLVAEGRMTTEWAWATWAAVSGLLAIAVVRKLVAMLQEPTDQTGTGASA